MKTLTTRWRLIALVPLAAIAILGIGNRIGAVPNQSRAIREAANEGGIWIGAGLTQGQVLRFDVARLASGHPGGINLELKVFDSQGNLVGSNTYVFPPNQTTPRSNPYSSISMRPSSPPRHLITPAAHS